jgi:hypothetical protein
LCWISGLDIRNALLVRNREACRNVDRVDRERCEARDERGTGRQSAIGVRRAIFDAIVAFCQIVLIGWLTSSSGGGDCSSKTSHELAAQTETSDTGLGEQ